MTRYVYAELREKAMSADATPEDRIALCDWFDRYDPADWNGEYYNIDNGFILVPIYKEYYDENGEFDYADLVDAEIRRV